MIAVHTQKTIKDIEYESEDSMLNNITECQAFIEELKSTGYRDIVTEFKSPKMDEPHLYIKAVKP